MNLVLLTSPEQDPTRMFDVRISSLAYLSSLHVQLGSHVQQSTTVLYWLIEIRMEPLGQKSFTGLL